MDYEALTHMTVNKLREEAKKFPDVKGVTAMKKDELIALLSDKLGLKPPARKTPVKKKAPATPLSKADIRKKIHELREARAAARTSGEHKQVAILRRRIHLLKRRMRSIA